MSLCCPFGCSFDNFVLSIEITPLGKNYNGKFELKSIGPFPNLTKLVLTNICVGNQSAFENLTNLKHISLSSLTMECECDISKHMPNLEVVHVNKLEFRGDGKITGFNNLAKLYKIEFYGGRLLQLRGILIFV